MAAKQQAPQPPAQQTLNLSMTLDAVAKDKGIERSVLVLTLESAILSAARKHLGGTRELVARYSERDGAVDLYQHMTVVDMVTQPDQEIPLDVARKMDPDAQVGEQLGLPGVLPPGGRAQGGRAGGQVGRRAQPAPALRKGFGRIAAQAAKQVIIQRVRDAERELIFNEYKDRKGEIITGIVRRFERNDIIVDLGRTEADPAVRATRSRARATAPASASWPS